MTATLQDLGRRAVAWRGWRWMTGMAYITPDGGGGIILDSPPRSVYAVPDFAAPSTMGCLQALVREAWGIPDISCSRDPTEDGGYIWVCGICRHEPFEAPTRFGEGDQEAEALVCALEAAP